MSAHPSPPEPVLRDASRADLDGLVALEAGFPGDRLTRRQFRHHLASPRARVRVATSGGGLLGSSLLLRRHGSGAARLYSLVVAPAAQGWGLGRALLEDACRLAGRDGACRMVLEVRADNGAALGLYQSAGFRVARVLPGYYEDGCDGLRLERPIP